MLKQAHLQMPKIKEIGECAHPCSETFQLRVVESKREIQALLTVDLHLEMGVKSSSHRKVKSLTVQVKLQICYLLLSFAFLKEKKYCLLFVMHFIIKHAVVAFTTAERESKLCEIVNHSSIVS